MAANDDVQFYKWADESPDVTIFRTWTTLDIVSNQSTPPMQLINRRDHPIDPTVQPSELTNPHIITSNNNTFYVKQASKFNLIHATFE